MPFTFSHPAAVLPFRKYCPRYLNLPALVAGSLTPDLGYYLHNWHWSVWGHSWLGSLRFDLPAGLILTALFYLAVRPVSRLLAHPHREALSSVCPVLGLPGVRQLLVVAVSVLLGAWTHIIWDGFTHSNGWCVREFSRFTPPLLMLGSYEITVWHILQHGSTLLGLFLLAWSYGRYAHSRRFLKHKQVLGPVSRCLIWLLMLIPPAVYAITRNMHILKGGITIPGLDEFSFNATVNYVCLFLPILFGTGIIVSVWEYLRLTACIDPLTTSPDGGMNERPRSDAVPLPAVADIVPPVLKSEILVQSGANKVQ